MSGKDKKNVPSLKGGGWDKLVRSLIMGLLRAYQ